MTDPRIGTASHVARYVHGVAKQSVARWITSFSEIGFFGEPDSRRRKLLPMLFAGMIGALLAVVSRLLGLSDPAVLVVGMITVFFVTPPLLFIRFGPLLPSEEFARRYPGIKQPGTK